MTSDFVNDGDKACKAVRTRLHDDLPMYDLILMDFSMPVMDGPNAAKIILKDVLQAQKDQVSGSSSLRRIKSPFICCVTAYTDSAHKQVASDSGMEMFVSKPLFKASLQRVLKRAGLL